LRDNVKKDRGDNLKKDCGTTSRRIAGTTWRRIAAQGSQDGFYILFSSSRSTHMSISSLCRWWSWNQIYMFGCENVYEDLQVPFLHSYLSVHYISPSKANQSNHLSCNFHHLSSSKKSCKLTIFPNPAMFLSTLFLAPQLLMCLANPLPNPQFSAMAPHCSDETSHVVSSTEEFDAPAIRAGGQCCSGDCELGAGEEHTVGVTITIGAELSLDL
jgi:hypothetical protein